MVGEMGGGMHCSKPLCLLGLFVDPFCSYWIFLKLIITYKKKSNTRVNVESGVEKK
jgi:hypothetical protein